MRTEPSRKRRLFLGLLTLLIGISVAIVAAEVIVRIANPQSLRTPHTIADDNYNHALNPGVTMLTHVAPEAYPVLLRVNSQGLAQENDVVIPKPAGVFRVLIIGDSFIQGLGHGVTLPAFVQSALGSWQTIDGRRIEIVNAGIQSYSPLLHFARYRHQYNDMQADAVIIFPDLTDVYDDFVRYRHLAEYEDDVLIRVAPSQAMAIENRLKHSLHYDDIPLRAYQYLVVKLARFLSIKTILNQSEEEIFSHALDDEKKPKAETTEAIRFSTNIMALFVEHLQSEDVNVAIMIYPHRAQVPSSIRSRNGRTLEADKNRLYEKSLVQLGRRLNVPVISFHKELSQAMSVKPIYFEGDMHFNIDGLTTLGALVSGTILHSSKNVLGMEITLARSVESTNQ